jgi:hypothetical protein
MVQHLQESVDAARRELWRLLTPQEGSVATSNLPVGDGPARVAARISGGQLKHNVEELILTPNIGPAHPSNLSLPHHVDHFITLNRSSRGLEFSESLLGVHSSFDGVMVLLDNVVPVLYRSRQRRRRVPSFLIAGIAEV